MKHRFHTFEKGITLVEIVVALSIVVILITFTTVSVISSLNNTQSSKNRSEAQASAQQGMEMLRQMRDTSWTTFDTFSGSYCVASTCTQLTASGTTCGPKPAGNNCTLNINNFYSRETRLDRSSASCNANGKSATKATVTVSWNSSKCSGSTVLCEKVVLESCFANIYGNSGI